MILFQILRELPILYTKHFIFYFPFIFNTNQKPQTIKRGSVFINIFETKNKDVAVKNKQKLYIFLFLNLNLFIALNILY